MKHSDLFFVGAGSFVVGAVGFALYRLVTRKPTSTPIVIKNPKGPAPAPVKPAPKKPKKLTPVSLTGEWTKDLLALRLRAKELDDVGEPERATDLRELADMLQRDRKHFYEARASDGYTLADRAADLLVESSS